MAALGWVNVWGGATGGPSPCGTAGAAGMTSVGMATLVAGLPERGRTVAGRGGEAEGLAAGDDAPSTCTELGGECGEYRESALDGTPACGSAAGRGSATAAGTAETERTGAGSRTTAGSGGIERAGSTTTAGAAGTERAGAGSTTTAGTAAATGGAETALEGPTEALGADGAADGLLATGSGSSEGRGAAALGEEPASTEPPRTGDGATAGGKSDALTLGVSDGDTA
jgi:hypothetical protein